MVEAAKLKVGKPLLVQKRQRRGGVHFGTIGKVPLFIALLVLGLHFFPPRISFSSSPLCG